MAVVIVLCVVSLAKRCPRGCGDTLLAAIDGIGKGLDQCGKESEREDSQPGRSKIETPNLTQYGHKIKPNEPQQKQIHL